MKHIILLDLLFFHSCGWVQGSLLVNFKVSSGPVKSLYKDLMVNNVNISYFGNNYIITEPTNIV